MFISYCAIRTYVNGRAPANVSSYHITTYIIFILLLDIKVLGVKLYL